MPADYDEYFSAFVGMVGGDGSPETTYYGREAGSADDWISLFESTGISFVSHAATIDAFENFLIAFYPQEGLSKDDWEYIRMDFGDMYGFDWEQDFDWEAWREAMGY